MRKSRFSEEQIVKRLKELVAENSKLKQLIGEKELDILTLKAALSKKY